MIPGGVPSWRAELSRIRYRLLLINLLIVSVPLLGIGFARFYEREMLRALEDDMIHQAQLLRQALLADPAGLQLASRGAMLAAAARDTRTRVRLLDAGGNVQADSHAAGPPEGTVEGETLSGLGVAPSPPAKHRDAARVVKQERAEYLLPTVVHCDSPDAAIAKKEYMFPFVTVVDCPEASMLEKIGPTLVCSAITCKPDLRRALVDATHIDRLNLGPVPTIQLNWLQPHEGNIVEFLYRARAFQSAPV